MTITGNSSGGVVGHGWYMFSQPLHTNVLIKSAGSERRGASKTRPYVKNGLAGLMVYALRHGIYRHNRAALDTNTMDKLQ
ncbi:hypothetical protein KCP74_23820 [Salmonella enterica subsp. enterica]|nr:hypothetical protein KCP74_23820 [Salmonella enterica subsp. enterica]